MSNKGDTALSLGKNLSFLAAITVILILLVLSILQIHWGNTLVINQAVNRVGQNIHSAWQTLKYREERLVTILKLTAERKDVKTFYQLDTSARQRFLNNIRAQWGLDICAVLDVKNDLLAPSSEPTARYIVQKLPKDSENRLYFGIVSIPPQVLEEGNDDLQYKCKIQGKLINSLFIFASVPLAGSQGKITGRIVAAIRLNNAMSLIDEIQVNLFKDGFYKGKRVGTVTIFSGPVRVATSVLLENGERATGTVVSKEVEQQVLGRGKAWTGRAFVVDTWYLSRYDPIIDPGGEIIGMLYIGELEQIYVDQKYRTLIIGLGAVSSIILLSALIGGLLIFQARKLDRERKRVRFESIRTLGHELKAPLNAIEGYLTHMEDRIFGDFPQEYNNMVSRSLIRLKYMRKLIADWLELARIETGQRKRNIAPNDLGEIAQKCIEAFSAEACEKNVHIHLHYHRPVVAAVDADEMQTIMNNLISNAIKYNREHGKVDILLEEYSKGVSISVTDTGIGMSDDEQGYLFQEFVRLKNDNTRHILGSGLGLVIVKKIVSLYKGDIKIQSKTDEGSTFTILIPH
jgi:signal transduction histidine kinase